MSTFDHMPIIWCDLDDDGFVLVEFGTAILQTYRPQMRAKRLLQARWLLLLKMKIIIFLLLHYFRHFTIDDVVAMKDV